MPISRRIVRLEFAMFPLVQPMWSVKHIATRGAIPPCADFVPDVLERLPTSEHHRSTTRSTIARLSTTAANNATGFIECRRLKDLTVGTLQSLEVLGAGDGTIRACWLSSQANANWAAVAPALEAIRSTTTKTCVLICQIDERRAERPLVDPR